MRGTRVVLALVVVLMAGFVPGMNAEGERCLPLADPAGSPVWPLLPESGAFDVVHFGEAHYNEGQGPNTMPILISEVVAYEPDLVTHSSDMADIGTYDRMNCFRGIMEPVIEAGIPWYNAPGNHDRLTVAGTPGGVVTDEIGPWRDVFSDMPAPWGDGEVREGTVLPADEPEAGPGGAATHYHLDYGPPGDPALRLIVLDNSRHTFTVSDTDQYPPVGPGHKDSSQLAYFARVAGEARDAGLLTFAMMHEPTQDPRDITKAYPISYNHTMNKGATTDNIVFDSLALLNEVDGVLLGHILGNFEYRFGSVPYFIDGGAGGTPYTTGETGIDSGYYYAFRILRFFKDGDAWTYRTYVVPLVDRIEVTAPESAGLGETVELAATVVQPFDEALTPRFPLMPHEAIEVELRAPDPTRIDSAALPHVAYMWSTSDPDVLRPVPGEHDPVGDPSFDPATMTTSGRFEAVGTGEATVTIAVGTHAQTTTVTVG